MFKKLLPNLGKALLVGALLLLPISVGSRAESAPGCPANYLCWWEGANFSGRMGSGPHDPTPNGCWNFVGITPVRSAINNTPVDLTMRSTNCSQSGGSAFYLRAGEARGSFPYPVPAFNRCRSC